MNESAIDIKDLIQILKKRWKMIVAITTIATIFSIFISFFILSPKYEASTKVFIGKESGNEITYSANDIQMYQQLLKTYAEVITTHDLIEKAIDKESLDITSDEVLKGLTVTPTTNTQILELQYVSEDNVLAKDVLNSIASQFIITVTELIPNADVKIIESVKLPETPVSPNKNINIAITFLIGLIISVGLAFLVEYMNNTLKTPEQLEQMLSLPVIGTIPNELDQRRVYNV